MKANVIQIACALGGVFFSREFGLQFGGIWLAAALIIWALKDDK